MGKVSDSSTFSDNDWEEVKWEADTTIKNWIDRQMQMRSCIVVLIGSNTASRKWVKYEIEKAYELGKGIVGIYVHNLKDSDDGQSSKGSNPFDKIFTHDGKRLSEYVEAYDSPYSSSTYVYNDIDESIEQLIEDAINNRVNY